VTVAAPPAVQDDDPGLARESRRLRPRLAPVLAWDPPWALLVGGAIVVLAAGVALRLTSTGPLWLDEAQSVDIARLPLPGLFTALRHDGSPPLYYLLLHVWIRAFGQSTGAVRTLSSVFSILTLPVAYLAARRLAGTRVAQIAVLLLAASPYAVRYATETRMYSLETLLVCVAALVFPRAIEHPTRARLAGVTVVTALLAYTHYWALYLLATVAVGLAIRRQWRVLAAMGAAVVLYLPWAPSMVFQLTHTGTPWAPPAGFGLILSTLRGWAGVSGGFGGLLALLTAGLALLGVLARSRVRRPVDLLTSPPGQAPTEALPGLRWARRAGWLWLGTLTVAALAGLLLGSAYALRYTAVALPFFLLVVARGVLAVPGRRLRYGVLALTLLVGLWSGWGLTRVPRTQARGVALAIVGNAAVPGDVVGYCPDQLAPDVSRLLPGWLRVRQFAFADAAGPALVDWVNYSHRMASASPFAFARRLVAAAPRGGTVFLVVRAGYRTLGDDCGELAFDLAADLGPPTEEIVADGHLFEPENLLAFPVP
jgi:hypothetical protein